MFHSDLVTEQATRKVISEMKTMIRKKIMLKWRKFLCYILEVADRSASNIDEAWEEAFSLFIGNL